MTIRTRVLLILAAVAALVPLASDSGAEPPAPRLTGGQPAAEARVAPVPASPDFFIVTTLKRKPGVTPEAFRGYLRDVHGTLAARLPDMRQYWQNHLSFDEGGAWPRTPGVSYDFPEGDRFDASNPASYESEDAFKRFFTTVGKVFLKDEANLFSETVLYTVRPGNARLFADSEPANRLGFTDNPAAVRFLVMLKRADGVSDAAFRRYLSETLTPALAADPARLLRLRLFLFEPVDNAAAANASADGVAHTKAADKQYHAAWEIAFPDRLAMRAVFDSAAYRATLAEQPRVVREIHPLRISAQYGMVLDGKVTTVGLRGLGAARLIKEIGAANQLETDVESILLGKPNR